MCGCAWVWVHQRGRLTNEPNPTRNPKGRNVRADMRFINLGSEGLAYICIAFLLFIAMSTSQTVDSLQVKLVREFIEGFNKKDVNIIAKNLHKDYRRILYPRSLGKPAVPREEWLEQCGKMIGHWIDPQVSRGSSRLNALPLLNRPIDHIPFHCRCPWQSRCSRSCLKRYQHRINSPLFLSRSLARQRPHSGRISLAN